MPVCYVICPTFSLLGGLVSTILLGLWDAKIAQDFPEKLPWVCPPGYRNRRASLLPALSVDVPGVGDGILGSWDSKAATWRVNHKQEPSQLQEPSATTTHLYLAVKPCYNYVIPGWWCNNHFEKWWSSSMGRMTFHIWNGTIIQMFQTTNQIPSKYSQTWQGQNHGWLPFPEANLECGIHSIIILPFGDGFNPTHKNADFGDAAVFFLTLQEHNSHHQPMACKV